MKANFKFDPDFPVIDGVGHSDKLGYVNVKGGGSTNTTLFDCGYNDAHCWQTYRSPVAVSTNVNSCRVGPNFALNDSGAVTSFSPDCLSSPPQGDTRHSRASDRILMDRIEVSGSFTRVAGTEEDDYLALPAAPKVAVFLVLDLAAVGAALGSESILDTGNGVNSAGSIAVSGLHFPWFFEHPVPVPVGHVVPESRFLFLASQVIDFALNPETRYDWVDYADTTVTTGGPLPVAEDTTIVTRTRYSFWRTVNSGFRFDVDLNRALCSFSGNTATITQCSDLALHLFAYCFDGVSNSSYVPHAFGTLSLSYSSRFWFHDFLSPSVAVAPGVDGGAFPDEEAPLVLLADQSAAMAGDAAVLMAADRPFKRTKAGHGFYNFRPRSGDAMLFEDDPEFARLQRRKGDSRSRAPDIVQRRFKSHKYDDNEDFHAREGDRGGKRGKY